MTTEKNPDKLAEVMEMHKAGRVQEAEKGYLELLSEEPENGDLMYTLATLYLGDNRLDEALEWVNKALKVNSLAPAYLQLKGAILAKSGQFEQALEAYQQAIEKNPNLYAALVGAGFIENQLGHVNQAEKHLKQALHVQPEGLEARLHLADIQIEKGDIEKAMADLSRLEEAHPDNTAVKMVIGKGLYEKRNWAGAQRYFDKVLAMVPGDILARYYKALSQLWMGDAKNAAEVIKGFVKQFPETREAFMALGKTAFIEKQYPLAAKYLGEVVKKNAPTSAKLALGQALSKMGHWPDARFWLLQVLEQRPEDSTARLALAETYEFQGKTDKALEAYKKIGPEDPRHLSALLGLARSHLAAGQPVEAEKAADKALELMPNHAEAMLLKLWSLFAQDKTGDAELFLLTIPMNKFKASARAPLLLSKALFEDHQGQFDQAWETFALVPPARQVPRYPVLTKEEEKTVRSWPESIRDNQKIPTFVMGYDSTDIKTFSLWLKAQGLEVLNDRLAAQGRPDIFYALQKVDDLDAVNEDTTRQERALYWQHIKPWLGEEDRDVVDFMFLNPHQGTLIKRFFPEAKVLVLQRDTKDIALHQHAFGAEPVLANEWDDTVNQLINMGLNVEQIDSDKWLAGDEATLKHLHSLFNKPLEKPVLRDVPWWRKSRFDAGHWKNYASHLNDAGNPDLPEARTEEPESQDN